jgi:hypothetical protein
VSLVWAQASRDKLDRCHSDLANRKRELPPVCVSTTSLAEPVAPGLVGGHVDLVRHELYGHWITSPVWESIK